MNVIEGVNITKIYRIYDSPVQRLKEIILRKSFHSDFVALNNISFAIKKGETFGILGENGAGKSTLLKILANTLKPTSGTLNITGRSAALLELGAGFNPELTGEENIYLNAYLMGLKKDEVNAKKDEIIGFSELKDFIKRPVKTYSSGMYIRLAFSIATSVDPEILIVDEALSVGDEYFQKKSIDRMMDFKAAGKTILFCSHNMYYVQELCSMAIWLHKGRIRSSGDTDGVVMDYLNYEREKIAKIKTGTDDPETDNRVSSPVRIADVKILQNGNPVVETIQPFSDVTFSFRLRTARNGLKGHLGFGIIRNDDVIAYATLTNFYNSEPVEFVDKKEIQVSIDSFPLLPGLYKLKLVVTDKHGLHPYDVYLSKYFKVENTTKDFGIIYINHEWKLR